MRRALLVVVCASAAAGTGACGNSRTVPPDMESPRAPAAAVAASYPAAGLSFRAPANWSRRPGSAPLVATVSSGAATVAIWRYPRTEPLPRMPDELERARNSLVEAAQTRDRSLQVDSARALTVGGVPAVEVVGTETIAGSRRRVRSTHLYDRGVEIVVDAFASPAQFSEVDRTVFSPLLSSLKLSGPARSAR